MSNHRYTNPLLNSYLGHISQQHFFSRSNADNEMLAFRNGNPGACYSLHGGSHIMSTVSGHSTTGSLQMQPEHACVSIFYNNKIFRLT